MEVINFLEATKSVDPDVFIQKLQQFFNEIQSVGMDDAGKLVALYSTVDVLLANGMNKESVKVIKKACAAKMSSLFSSYPATVKEAAKNLKIIINTDESFGLEKTRLTIGLPN